MDQPTKRYSDHHFGLYASVVVGTNLTFRKIDGNGRPQASAFFKRANIDRGGSHALLRRYGQGTAAETRGNAQLGLLPLRNNRSACLLFFPAFSRSKNAYC